MASGLPGSMKRSDAGQAASSTPELAASDDNSATAFTPATSNDNKADNNIVSIYRTISIYINLQFISIYSIKGRSYRLHQASLVCLHWFMSAFKFSFHFCVFYC